MMQSLRELRAGSAGLVALLPAESVGLGVGCNSATTSLVTPLTSPGIGSPGASSAGTLASYRNRVNADCWGAIAALQSQNSQNQNVNYNYTWVYNAQSHGRRRTTIGQMTHKAGQKVRNCNDHHKTNAQNLGNEKIMNCNEEGNAQNQEITKC
jgi:hypothetical protein